MLPPWALCSLCLLAPCLGARMAAQANNLHDLHPDHPAAAEALFHRPTASLIDRSETQGSFKTSLKDEYSFYHTSEELLSQSRQLVSKCGGMASIDTQTRGDVSIDLISVKDKDARPGNRVFILCGEHSRELISPESCFTLLQMLCGEAQPGDGTPSVQTVLQDSEFQIVLNANPRSRARVEQGQYCIRENVNGVDLNRNWDEQWTNSTHIALTSPGPKAFSENETQILRDALSAFKPTTFITVHSGTFGMYMPWAYDPKQLAIRNQQSMMEVLREVDKRHCHCPFGGAGREVGYAAPGTCLDWVYDKLEAPFAFAFEIFTDGDLSDLDRRWQEKLNAGGLSLLQRGEHLAHPHFHDVFSTQYSDFVQVGNGFQADSMTTPDQCFNMFNPASKEVFDKTVQNWASAFLETSHQAAAKLKEDAR